MLQYGMRLQYNNVTVLQCYNVTMLILLLCYFPPFSKCVTKCITLCYTTPNTIGCVECNLPWARLHSQAIPPPHHYHCTPHNHRHNQGGEKYFTSWEPRFLGQYFARDSVIHGPAGADKKLILVKKKQFLSQDPSKIRFYWPGNLGSHEVKYFSPPCVQPTLVALGGPN